jgi:hypothetical protein
MLVMPAKAGIQLWEILRDEESASGIPAYAE